MNRMRLLPALCVVVAVAASMVGCRKQIPDPRVTLNGHTFGVEVATTVAEQRRGLSGRPSLPADRAMLFVFRSSADRTFHMKQCYFPIDIAFLDADRKIINLTTMVVEPDPETPVERYTSDAPAKYVLEAAGGTWERIGAGPGTVVEFADVFDER